MTLEWIDGFDHYGGGTTGAPNRLNLLDGPYAEIGLSSGAATSQMRTGTHSLFAGAGTPGVKWRRVLGAARTRVGVGHGIYVTTLPTSNDRMTFLAFRDAANAAQISITLQTTGAIAVYRGTPATGTLLATATTLLTAAAWSHIEAACTFSQTVGTVEVRLNGVTIINLSGIDTCETALVECSQIAFNDSGAGSGSGNVFVDDLYAWNSLGSQNNDFIGDQKVYLILPDADTAENDWTPDTGTVGFSRINAAAPDADTSYITATAIPESSQAVSEFGLADLPAEISAITGVMVTGKMRKTDAGTCQVMQSLVSGSSIADGSDRPLTTLYTYWPDIFELDPATGAPWTRTAFNAALLRFSRTQ